VITHGPPGCSANWKTVASLGWLHVNIESPHANVGELFDSIRELRFAAEQDRANIQELSRTVTALREEVRQGSYDLLQVATVHEERLDRYEVTVVAFQEDVRDIKSELRAIRERWKAAETAQNLTNRRSIASLLLSMA
jgi:hypothetical protein